MSVCCVHCIDVVQVPKEVIQKKIPISGGAR